MKKGSEEENREDGKFAEEFGKDTIDSLEDDGEGAAEEEVDEFSLGESDEEEEEDDPLFSPGIEE